MKSATITNIDLPLFRKQRNTLITIALYPDKFNLTKKQADHIDGLVNLTDKIYDDLVDSKPVKPKKHKCGAALSEKELFYGHCLECGEDIK